MVNYYHGFEFQCLLFNGLQLQQTMFLSIIQSTPMHMAAERGHNDILRYLGKKGANVSAKDIDGVSIL